jgi:pimeloyl-ACP methyl ester carboxylesterase
MISLKERMMNTQFLNVNGGKIAYDDTGSGPLVVCVPSLGDLRAEYRFLIPQLVAAGYRVISMDVRGHGETSTIWPDYSVAAVGADMLAMIRSLQAGPAVLIGTSMAAGAAVWADAETPDLVSGLVLIGAAVRGEVSRQNQLLYGALFTRPWGPAVWLRYFNTLFPTRKPADFAEYCAALQANLKEPGRLEAVRQMIFASKAASEARLGRVKAPALVIMGSKDADFKPPQAEAEWVANRVRGRYQMIADAGHYPYAEMPEITGPVILAFLDSLKETMEKPNGAASQIG